MMKVIRFIMFIPLVPFFVIEILNVIIGIVVIRLFRGFIPAQYILPITRAIMFPLFVITDAWFFVANIGVPEADKKYIEDYADTKMFR